MDLVGSPAPGPASALPSLRLAPAAASTHADPVCGMAVEEGRQAATETHEGTTYFFCSTGCAKRFAADPRPFLAGTAPRSMEADAPADYTPLVVLVGLIVLVTAVLSWNDARQGEASLESTLSYFMAGFFLVFAAFKLIDLKGFAEAYSSYDLLARRVPAYGFVYPFVELAFGLGMLVDPTSRPLLVAELAVMSFSGLGVAVKLAKREAFRCACLGTVLKVPLTTVTLVEDFGMAALALAMLLLA